MFLTLLLSRKCIIIIRKYQKYNNIKPLFPEDCERWSSANWDVFRESDRVVSVTQLRFDQVPACWSSSVHPQAGKCPEPLKLKGCCNRWTFLGGYAEHSETSFVYNITAHLSITSQYMFAFSVQRLDWHFSLHSGGLRYCRKCKPSQQVYSCPAHPFAQLCANAFASNLFFIQHILAHLNKKKKSGIMLWKWSFFLRLGWACWACSHLSL